jgi:hypothetical protein
MKRAGQYWSEFKRSVRRFASPALVFRPGFSGDQRQAAPANLGAKADLNHLLSRIGFLSIDEVPRVMAQYADSAAPWRDELLREAEGVCQRGLPLYETLTAPLKDGLNWSDPCPGAPQDRLYRLQPHRFGFLPRLVIAAASGANTLPTIHATVASWIAQAGNRPTSEGYYSNLVVIYRVVAISLAAPFCATMARAGDKTAALICEQLLDVIWADIHYLKSRLGKSIANNHLLADCFAAWFIAACYPAIAGVADIETLEQRWLEELFRQFQDDGTNFEQSIHYHELGCEMAALYIVISLRLGKRPAQRPLRYIGKMIRFQAALADEWGGRFALGDSTDDTLLPLDGSPGAGGATWRILYARLFGSSLVDTLPQARGAERAFWLIAAIPPAAMPVTADPELASMCELEIFPDNGYAAFRDSRLRQILLFRTGPRPGVKISPGHAMSDLLSVYWSLEGQAVLEPSGTYSYGARDDRRPGPASPRNYFRGPAASNGIVLTGHDPLGQPTGRFRDQDNGTRVTSRWRSLERGLNWVEGRLEKVGPLNGCRRGVIHVAGHYSLVYDRLSSVPLTANLFSHWQFAPEAEINLDERTALARVAARNAFFVATGAVAAIDCVQGRSDPPAGWVSRNYGHLQSAPQLICRISEHASDLVYAFGIHRPNEPIPSMTLRNANDAGMVVEIRRNNHLGIACIGPAAMSDGGMHFDLDFIGDVLWLDFDGEKCREFRAVGLQRLTSSTLGIDLRADSIASSPIVDWRPLERRQEGDRISGRWENRHHG